MFSFFFKRKTVPKTGTVAARGTPVSASAVPRSSAFSRPGFLDRLPVPEVKESHDESAWDEWEHSSMELDSRMGPLSTFDSVRLKDASPSQLSELDPFASVRKTR